VHNENGRSPFPIVANQADNSIPRALAADTAAADTAYGTGKFLAWIIGKRITYRYGVAGSGDQLVNLPHDLLWGLLDANRLISPREMNSRVFVPSAAL
jgi:hypothetical protein